MTAMEVGTWLSVVILGPGAIVIFIWFLWDFARMFAHARSHDPSDRHVETPDRHHADP
jgi:hypothetical protein